MSATPLHRPGMAGLVQVVQELSLARDIPAVRDVIRRAAAGLTGEDEVQLLQAVAELLATQLAAEVEERRRVEEEIRRLSLTDELTGIASRRGFLIRAEQARTLVRRRREPSVALFVEVDGIRRLNEDVGREAGDEMIKAAAALLAGAFRECDVVARWDGAEFVAFLPGAVNAAPACRRLDERVDRGNRHRPGRPLRLSVGSALVKATDTRPLLQVLAEAGAAIRAEGVQPAVPVVPTG